MTNYTKFPTWRYTNMTIVICFARGGCSWCTVDRPTLRYLKDNYISDDDIVFIKINGTSYKLPAPVFRGCIDDDNYFHADIANDYLMCMEQLDKMMYKNYLC